MSLQPDLIQLTTDPDRGPVCIRSRSLLVAPKGSEAARASHLGTLASAYQRRIDESPPRALDRRGA